MVSYINQNEGADPLAMGQPSPNIPEPDNSLAPTDVGSLKLNSTETKYQDQTHWNTILDAIAELKEDLGEPDNPKTVSPTPDPASINSLDSPLLYGCKRCTKDEILAAVPPKDLADCLVSECFELLELSSCWSTPPAVQNHRY